MPERIRRNDERHGATLTEFLKWHAQLPVQAASRHVLAEDRAVAAARLAS